MGGRGVFTGWGEPRCLVALLTHRQGAGFGVWEEKGLGVIFGCGSGYRGVSEAGGWGLGLSGVCGGVLGCELGRAVGGLFEGGGGGVGFEGEEVVECGGGAAVGEGLGLG